MIVFKNQNNFGAGQINPRLQSRVKEAIYEHGLFSAINCLIEPSGIIKKRYGTSFVKDLTSKGSAFTLIPFEYGVDVSFLLVFYNLAVDIYDINGAYVTTLVTPYGTSSLPNITYDQSVNNMILADGVSKPQQITYQPSWAISTVTFPNVPTYDFAQNYYSDNFTASHTYGSVTITATTGTPFYVALVGGLFIANGAVCRITGYTDSTHITVQTLGTTYFFTDSGSPSGTIAPISGLNTVIKEPVWSDARGWPTNPRLHNNRLWFGGTSQRPQGTWGSVAGDYFNFDEGVGLPDDAISVNIDSQQLNTINHLVSGQSLVILTNSGVYVLAQNPDGSISVSLECKEGSTTVEPVFIDSQLLYAQRGGQIIRNFIYNFGIRAYENTNISIYASDSINNPVDSAVLKYNDNESTNYVFFINADGSIALYQTERAQQVSAFTTLLTENTLGSTSGLGSFKNCAAVGNSLFFVVERHINNVPKYYLEQIDPNTYFDCYITFTSGTPTQTVTGLSALNGKTVGVIRDGYIETHKVVVDGMITSDEKGLNFIIGLPIVSDMVPLPLGMDYVSGPTTYYVKTIRNLFLDVYNTFGIKVDGVLLPYFVLDEYILNSQVQGVTDILKIPYLKNWDLRQNIHITHDYPTPFTICGIGYEIVMDLPS